MGTDTIIKLQIQQGNHILQKQKASLKTPTQPQTQTNSRQPAAVTSGETRYAGELQFDDNRTQAAAQRRLIAAIAGARPAQRLASPTKPNTTGLPDNLKSGIESLSGMSMDSVKVHYNSDKPVQLNERLADERGKKSESRLRNVAFESAMHGAAETPQQSKMVAQPPVRRHLLPYPAGAYSGVQFVTQINHDTADFEAQGQGFANFTVGSGMQAILNPSEPVAGSAASWNSTLRLDAICTLFVPRLKQTHLLNADLGGFGVYENLYPMTAKTNREH
jgi:hypothetical protein